MSRSILTILTFYSGSSLLAMERANTDLVIFLILFFSAVTTKWLSVALNLIGVALKIYPFFALIAFIKNIKLFFWGILISVAIFYLYRDQLSIIINNTQISYGASYGSLAISNGIVAKFGLFIDKWWINFVILLLSLWLLSIESPLVKSLSVSDLELKMCIMGSCIYVGSFLLMSNWDYRLVFLNLCLPLISTIQRKKIRNLILLCLLLSCNQFWLHSLFGLPGAIFNMLAKFIMCIICLTFILHVVKDTHLIWKRSVA